MGHQEPPYADVKLYPSLRGQPRGRERWAGMRRRHPSIPRPRMGVALSINIDLGDLGARRGGPWLVTNTYGHRHLCWYCFQTHVEAAVNAALEVYPGALVWRAFVKHVESGTGGARILLYEGAGTPKDQKRADAARRAAAEKLADLGYGVRMEVLTRSGIAIHCFEERAKWKHMNGCRHVAKTARRRRKAS